MKHTQAEWDKLITVYPPGTCVSGTVRACERFGVLVLLDELPDVPCLLEINHFGINESFPRHSIQFPMDYPQIGERINAKILAWTEKAYYGRLTQISHLNWITGNAMESSV